MKKIKILALSVVTLALSLSSCSSDDNNSGSLEGKWTLIKAGTVIEGKEILTNIPNEGKCESDYTEYTADGKFTDFAYEYTNNKCELTTDKGTWTLKDKTLSISLNGGVDVDTYEIVELTGSTLKVKETEKIDETNSMVLIYLFERK